MYLDAYSFKKIPATAYLTGMYKTNIIVNNRVLIRYRDSDSAAGWMPIMCPHCHTRMNVPYGELEI